MLRPLVYCADVEQAFYSEVAVRLVVLINMLRQHGAAYRPLYWLMFILSDEGSRRVRDVHSHIIKSRWRVTSQEVQELLDEVAKLQSAGVPAVLVDELQLLASKKVHSAAGEMSLMKAVVQAAALLACPVVWSGTRMGVTAASSQHSGIAKYLTTRKLLVVGDFEYLTAAKVKAYLESTIEHSASAGMLQQLGHLLQGRARMVSGFIAALLAPGSPSMRSGAQLDDAVLRDVLEDFMEKLVVQRFHREIQSMRSLPGANGMGDEDLGCVWCLSMLNNFESTAAAKRDTVNRGNSLAFTSHVHEVQAESPSSEFESNVAYEFDYIFGEPGLQEALLRIVWKEPAVADAGIRSILRGALTGSALGSYLDYAVALALISRRDSVLVELCRGHPVFSQYAAYELQISRVVCTSSAEDQHEWFKKVIADPENDTFSLLPGVPVKNIAILPSVLSGADFICVALQAPPGEPAGPLPPTDLPPCAPPPSPPAPRYMTRKRKLETAAAQEKGVVEEAPKPKIVFVQVCCANYKGGVPSTKHNDQASKATDQFSAQAKRRCLAGDRYKEVAQQNASLFKYVPVLVEIPQDHPDPSDGYILVTEKEARVFFSEAVVDVFNR